MDWAEDNFSGSSSDSPQTVEDALPSKPRQLSANSWDLPSFGRQAGLELYDGPLEGFQSSKFSFTGESLPGLSPFGFDALGDFGADTYGLNEAIPAHSMTQRGVAFDQIGMNEEVEPSVFHSRQSESNAENHAIDWHSFADGNYIQPSDLQLVNAQPLPMTAYAEVPSLDHSDFESTAVENIIMPELADPSTSPNAPKIRKKLKDLLLPPLASSPADAAGALGLLILGLKADVLAEPDRAYHSRVETSLRLHLALVSATGEPNAPRPAAHMDAFGKLPEYSDHHGSLKAVYAEKLRRIGNYRYIELDKSSPVFKTDIFEPPPEETLYLESHIYFASSPDQVVPFRSKDMRCNARASKGCIPREMKRWQERVTGVRRSQAEAKEELLTGLDPAEAQSHFEQWIEGAEALMYNEAEVQDFSEGYTSVQLRILHYARCFNEERQQGYFIVLTLRNHLGQTLAKASTPAIFMTDNHKGSSSRNSATHSPVDSGADDISVSSRGSRKGAAIPPGRSSTSGRPVRRTSSTDSRESRASSKRAAEPSSPESKRRKSSTFASRSSLCMTPREAPLSGLASPTWMEQQQMSAPASPGALRAELARMPQAKRETSPSTDTSSSAMSPPPADLIAGLHRAEQQAPLIPPQRSRASRPRIEDVIPTEGSIRGGNRVAVIGSGFRQGTVVYFGLTPSQTEYRGSSSLVCTLPAAPCAGPVHVHFGTEAAEDPLFTYLDDAEQTLTTQSVSVVAAMLGMTSLDLTARFSELRQSGQVSGNRTPAQVSTPSDMLPLSRARRASIGDGSGSPPRSPLISAHSRTKSLTDLTMLNSSTRPSRNRKATEKHSSTESLLLSLFELPSRRLAPHLFAEAIIRGSTPEGQNVLHLASLTGFEKLVELLVARGAPLDLIDTNGMTALHFATLHARIGIIRVLIDGGAPTSKRNAEGLTPFKIAEDVLEREEVIDAFPFSARSRSLASSQSSLFSYFASGSDYSESAVFSDDDDDDDDDDEQQEDYAQDRQQLAVDPETCPPDEDISGEADVKRKTLSECVLRSIAAPQTSTVKSDDEDTLIDNASVATARPTKSSKWYQLVDTENVFWSPISTAWWQPRRAEEAPGTSEGLPAPRMYGPSEATVVHEKASVKVAKTQAASRRRIGYDSGKASPPLDRQLEIAFHSIKKHRSLWHDRKLFLIWIPALLLAIAYFLHSAALLPGTFQMLENLLPRIVGFAGPAEIRWHSTQPIYSVDFSAIPADEYKKQFNPYERAAKSEAADLQAWRLATAGGDNQVRLWLVTPTPNSIAVSKAGPSGTTRGADPAKVEYLTTLSKHQAVVNCVRFSPFGTTLASAGDDGNIILWQQGDKQAKEFGSDTSDELAYAREFWKVKRVMRFTQQEVYDLAWSPDGDMLVAGSTDNTARICRVSDGTCVQQITDHHNYVQGVAWDPLNNFLATQSSDRHMHVYGLKYAPPHGSLSVSLVGKNTKLDLRQSRHEHDLSAVHDHHRKSHSMTTTAPTHEPVASTSANGMGSSGSNVDPRNADRGRRPSAEGNEPLMRVESTALANTGSAASPLQFNEPNGQDGFRPPAPKRTISRQSDSDRSESGSVSMGPPALGAAASGRRSSFSGSPPIPPMRRLGRSPSPVPPLPAIRPPVDHPSPQPSAPLPGPSSMTVSTAATAPPVMPLPLSANVNMYGGQDVSPFFRRLAWSTDGSLLLTPAGLFTDPFGAQAKTVSATPTSSGPPPHKKRKGSADGSVPTEAKPVDAKPTVYIYTRAGVANAPVAHLSGHKTGTIAIRFNPILFTLRKARGASQHVTLQNTVIDGEAEVQPKVNGTAEEAVVTGNEEDDIAPMLRLPHRMVYAVATHDSVLIYDTQQSTPVCFFGNLHYAPFTDVAWTADGLTLVLASQDGYCSLVSFNKGELGEPLPDGSQTQRPAPPVETPQKPTGSSAPATEVHKAPPITIPSDPAPGDALEGDNRAKKRRVALTFEGPIA